MSHVFTTKIPTLIEKEREKNLLYECHLSWRGLPPYMFLVIVKTIYTYVGILAQTQPLTQHWACTFL